LTGSLLWKRIVKFNIVYVITSDELFNNVYKWFSNISLYRRERAAATSQRGHLSVYTIFINRLIRNLFRKRLCTRNNPFSVTKLVFLGPPQRGFRCLRRKRKKQITENRYRWLPTYPPNGYSFELLCHNSLMTIFYTA